MPALLLDVVGRKALITGCALTYFFVWLGTASTSSVWIICWMRFLFGVACGTNNATNTIYLAEVSSPSLRAVFGTLILTLYYLGMLVEYAAATYLTYRVNAIVNTCLGFLTMLSVFFVVESAQFLLLKGEVEQAKRNFMWLKGVTDMKLVKEEFEQIQQNVQLEKRKKTSFRQMLTSPANYKSVLIVMFAYSLPDAAGYTAILTFSSIAFSSTATLTQNEFTILLGVAQFLVSWFPLLFVNRFGRRTLLISSYCAVTLIHVFAAALYYVDEHVQRIQYFPWIIFSTVALFVAITVLVYPAVFALRGELFPISVKAIGGCVVVFANSATNFVSTKVFLYVCAYYGMYANFISYAAISLVFVLLVYFCLPETRNKSLTEIQEELSKGRVKSRPKYVDF